MHEFSFFFLSLSFNLFLFRFDSKGFVATFRQFEMDSESQQIPNQSIAPVDLESENGPSTRHLEQPRTHCILCRRPFVMEAEMSQVFEEIFICRDCKLVVLDGLDTNDTTATTTRETSRTRPERQVRSGSSESIEDMFSQQLTELISLARQNHDTHRISGYNIYHNRSRRWRRALSDTGSESHDPVDLCFGDNDSIISFTGNGAESDVSLDGHSYVDTENFIRQGEESHVSSDTDIDPMHAGQDHWNSDEDDDDEDGEWEEVEEEEAAEFLGQDRQIDSVSDSPTQVSRGYTQDDGWLFWRTHSHTSMRYPDLFNDMEEADLPLFLDHPRFDARGFEVLLEQLAEDDSARRGPPPAAASCLRTLPLVIISKAHEKNGSLVCAVCKDPLPVGTETNHLPCLHFYHPCCILPWLRTRSTCPVCRYELPTDDPDYEEGKRNMIRNIQLNQTPDENIIAVGESSSITVTGEERDGSQGDINELEEEEEEEDRSTDERRGRRIGGWRYLAEVATPIVSIVGMVLVMWLGTSLANTPTYGVQGRDSNQISRNNTAQESRVIRHRRWWSFL